MKTAISIPDDVFADAERLAVELHTSRSRLYTRAVREFVARHAPEQVTALLDDVVADEGAGPDELAAAAASAALHRTEW